MYRSYTNFAVDKFPGKAIIVASTGETAMTPKERNSKLTAAWLRENMDYAPDTGVFMWKKRGFGRTVGKPLGSKLWTKGAAYLTMKVDGTVYYAHRLAWLYHYGEWPAQSVDHIDGDRTNNAIENLRVCTAAQNAARRPTSKRNIAPSRGVFPHGTGYVARIHFGNKRHYLGYFPTAEEARVAYEKAAKKIHGEFAHASEAPPARGDYLNATQCEICGSSDRLRYDRTRLGTPRGMLCIRCWGLVTFTDHNPKEIWRLARNAARYIENLDVPEDPPPPPREEIERLLLERERPNG